MDNAHPSRFTPRNDLVPTVQEAGWSPEPGWKGAKNLVPTGIQSLDCPARIKSLHHLHNKPTLRCKRTVKINMPIVKLQVNCLLGHYGMVTGIYLHMFQTAR